MNASEYQKKVVKILKGIFGDEMVQPEWSVRTNTTDGFRFKDVIYAPRLDIAVGPFNTTKDARQNTGNILKTASESPLIRRIRDNVEIIENKNPRCLLAIEIEFSGSSKHILGDIANACMMGLIGVVIGTKNNSPKISRVSKYIETVVDAEKAPQDLFMNLALFDTDDFLDLINLPTSLNSLSSQHPSFQH